MLNNDELAQPVEMIDGVQRSAARRQIRGSTLFLLGRVLRMGVDFLALVIMVNYLSKGDYGAFRGALAFVSVASSIIVFGLDKTLARFLPIYDEHRDDARMFGALVLSLGTIAGLGLAVVLLVHGLQGVLGRIAVSDAQAMALLLVLILLAPIQAFSSVMFSLLAIFAKPREIFIRRFVFGPGIHLAVVALLVFQDAGVGFLAVGWVVAGLAGVAVYTIVLFHLIERRGLFGRFKVSGLRLPVREIYSFTIPLLASDFVFVLRGSLLVILLGAITRDSSEVAALGAVMPLAQWNMIVRQTFTILYTPLASRLFARNDHAGINELYWESAVWIALITFPIFLVTFSLAVPLTAVLFPASYADSALILSIVALGYYLNAILGINGLTLRVYGKVGFLVAVDLVGGLVSLVLSVLLISRFGAIGAGVALASTLILQNVAYQIGLVWLTGVELVSLRYARIYLLFAAGAAAVLAVQLVLDPPLPVGGAFALIVAGIVLWLSRGALRVARTFPELMRLPLADRLFGDGR